MKSLLSIGLGVSIAAISIAAGATTAPLHHEERAPVATPQSPRLGPCGVDKWRTFIAEAARRFDLLERWIEALVRAESAGCVLIEGRPTTSTAGAMGLMQLMPKTWETYRQRLALGTDPHDPRDNILAGAAYLRDMYDRFGWPGAAAAYHSGPARYSEYLLTGRPLPLATLEYVARINRILDIDTPNVADALFVPLRYGTQRPQPEPKVTVDVQDK